MYRNLSIFILFLFALCVLTSHSYACSKHVVRQGDNYEKVFSSKDKKYIIKEDLNLGGKTIKIGEGSTLVFKGGSLSNGVVVGTDTKVKADNYTIFKSGSRKYRGYLKNGYSYVSSNNNTLEIKGTWNNTKCENDWTGMNSYLENDCASLAINNYLRLHRKGCRVIFPSNKTYHVYGKIDCTGYSVNFNNSTIISIDFSKVEDNSLPLPSGVTPSSLRSIYGLVFFQSDNAILENLTIDGSASSRNEEPILGSECLIAMGSNINATLRNITLKDSVDCGICTYTISNCTIENVRIENCGEHGFYTHCYQGDISFTNCKFVNCGQCPTIYHQRGQSACVRFSAMRDHKAEELQTLRAYFYNCVFSSSGLYDVATMYSDLPYAEFHNCTWNGVGGYTVASAELAERIGKLVEYKFYDCINPCAKINSINTIRRLFHCRDVHNPFADAVEINDCEIVASYADVENKYSFMFESEYNTPLQVKDSRFIKNAGDVSVRNTLTRPRPILFDNCTWDFGRSKVEKNKGTYYIVLAEDQHMMQKVTFRNCIIDIDNYRLLSSEDTDVIFDNSSIVKSYPDIVGAGKRNANSISVLNN